MGILAHRHWLAGPHRRVLPDSRQPLPFGGRDPEPAAHVGTRGRRRRRRFGCLLHSSGRRSHRTWKRRAPPHRRHSARAAVIRYSGSPCHREAASPMSLRTSLVKRLGTRAGTLAKAARAAVLFRRWTFTDRIVADGYVRVRNHGTLRLARYVDFRGGIVPSDIVVQAGAELSLGESTAINYGVSIECTTRI